MRPQKVAPSTQQLTPSEQLAYSSVRLEAEDAKGSVSTGSGFFFHFLKSDETNVPAIVTNRHVLVGAIQTRFHLTLATANNEPEPGSHLAIVMDDFQWRWIDHPDPSCDLAAVPIAPLLVEGEKQGKKFFFIGLDSLLPTQEDLVELGALEDVIMVGYPNGIWDSTNNMPIFRRGITATHPNRDYEGRQEFMIDAACFPGSSGSPVFLYNIGSWPTRDGGMVMGGLRLKLLGVLYAGPQHTATGEVQIVTVPTAERAIAVSAIPNNLGVVIKSGRLPEFDKEFDRLADPAV